MPIRKKIFFKAFGLIFLAGFFLLAPLNLSRLINDDKLLSNRFSFKASDQVEYLMGFSNFALSKSPDAIAMRIISNPDHYSALRWYNEKVTVKGSPQLLSVDGYPAVRDGRSVYVSAANVDQAAVILYTNIYIISYNQEAEQATQDIFGQIIGSWRFNINLDSSAGFCSKAISQSCLTDKECGESGYCSSFKAKVTRDTVRMARLMDLKASLESYKKKKNKYPSLSAGSYLPAKSISVWPSWQESLGKELAATPPIDPINKLAPCAINFDPATCWDQAAKSFAWSIPTLPTEEIPTDNLVFTYSAAASGASYKLCGYSESSLMDPALRCSACVPNICVANGGPNSCGPNGCGTGFCAPGCSGAQVCSGGSCVSVCSTPEGCQTSLADASPITGYCATGLCYQCNTGFSWTGTICSAVVPVCSILPGCLTSAPANSTPVAGTCAIGACYQCNTGYTWDGTTCAAVVPACSAAPGCRTSVPANSTSVAGACAIGACYQCNTGYTWNGTTCEANCSTSEGCRTSLTNGSPTSGYCAIGACYQCNTGYTWDGTTCAAVVPACSAAPGCRTSVPANSTSVAGACAIGACYQCNAGYTWNGLVCELNCTTPPGCRTSLTNASVVSGYCSTGSCYSCNGGYFWDGLQCALSGPACSTPPGCQLSLVNATMVAGICAIGECYSCNTGYTWDGTTCAAVVPACSAAPGCRTSVPANSTSVAGACAIGACYQCNTGYTWNGTTCEANCSTSEGCRTSLTNGSPTSGYCATGACYQCNTGYTWNGTTCEANCSTSEGCRTSLTNGSPTSGYCAIGACYQCNTGYTWDGTTCAAVVPACSAAPGCRTSVPANSTSVVGACAIGACYQCNTGYSWDGSLCSSAIPTGCTFPFTFPCTF